MTRERDRVRRGKRRDYGAAWLWKAEAPPLHWVPLSVLAQTGVGAAGERSALGRRRRRGEEQRPRQVQDRERRLPGRAAGAYGGNGDAGHRNEVLAGKERRAHGVCFGKQVGVAR